MIDLVTEDALPSIENIVDVPTTNPLEVYKIALQLEALCEKEGGVGLSAIQIGIPWRLFVIKSDGSANFARKGEYGYFLNCHYEPTTNQRAISLESCLSLRSPRGRLRHFQVERYSEIRVSGLRIDCDKELNIIGYDEVLKIAQQAMVFQHELDHHRAVLVKNIGTELFLWR